MARVRHQPVAVEILREYVLASTYRFFDIHPVEARTPPRRLGTFDDEGRRIGIELIRVRPDPTEFRFLENEREGVVELLPGAEPDILAGPHVDVRLEDMLQTRSHLGIDAVRGDDQVEILVTGDVTRFGLVLDLH